jgi:hypothetical protein
MNTGAEKVLFLVLKVLVSSIPQTRMKLFNLKENRKAILY